MKFFPQTLLRWIVLFLLSCLAGLGMANEQEITDASSDEESTAPERTRRIPVITYHHHLPLDLKVAGRYRDGSVTNSVESFREQMAWLRENGYSSLTLAEFEAFLDHGADPAMEKKVLITFDDGYLTTLKFCYPILKECGFTAVVFLITGRQPALPEARFLPEKLQYISLAEMASASDVFEWAGHTHNLHSMKRTASRSDLLSADSAVLNEDVALSRALLGQTRHFCFPFGQYDEQVTERLSQLGFRYFYTTENGWTQPQTGNKLMISRLNISPGMTLAGFARLFRDDV